MTKRRISAAFAIVCLLGTVGLRAQTGSGGGSRSDAGVVPRMIKYSGAIDPQLVRNKDDESGKNASPAVVSLTFSLYELQEGGGTLWSESQKIQLDQRGRYGVFLGATNVEGLPLDLFTSGKALWLGVQPEVPGAVELPRVLLVAVPYALKASDADTLGGKPASAYALAGSTALSVANGSASSEATATPMLATRATLATPMSASPAAGVVPFFESATTTLTPIKPGQQANAPSKGVNNTATGVGALVSDTTGSNNTADGYGALFTNTTGYFNTGVGEAALTYNTSGYYNTADGGAALFYNTTGSGDTASGAGALQYNTTGSNNTATGALALFTNITGSGNTATGYNAGLNLTGGSSNIMEGSLAGVNFKSTESNNIDIGNQGVTGDSGVIRLGTPGAQTAAYIAGISGVTPSGSPLPVVINANGQLGTGTSAAGTISGVTAGAGLTGGGTSGTVSLSVPSAGVTDAMLANAYSGVGSCGTGKVVSGLTRDAAPTCVAAGTGTGTVTSVATGAGLAGGPITTSGTLSIAAGGVANSMLQNPSLTVNAGTGLSGGGAVALGSSLTLSNTGVLSVGTSAGSGILVGGTAASPSLSADPSVLATNTSVASAVAGGVTAAETYASGLPFLPLAGGTLTGGLNGTTAGFSTINSANPYQIGGSNVLSADGSYNVFVGTPESANPGFLNTATGYQALVNLNGAQHHTATENTATGYMALNATTTGASNTANGANALVSNTTGGYNTATGVSALYYNTTGSNNVAVGLGAGISLTAGSSNIMVGYNAGQNFSSGESNNIDIGNGGSGGESNVIRIGTVGTQTAVFIAGINGASAPAHPLPVVIDPVTGQLAAGSASGGTITGVTAGTGLSGGGASGNVSLSVNESVVAFQSDLAAGIATAENVATSAAEAYSNSTFLPLAGGTLTGALTGTTASFSTINSDNPYQIGATNVLSVDASSNVFVGSPEPASPGSANTATGYQALFNTNGDGGGGKAGGKAGGGGSSGKGSSQSNTATGYMALYANTTGSNNTVNGANALLGNTTGGHNTASGASAGSSLTSGDSNIMVGFAAGQNFSSSESNNIDIGNGGLSGESNVIRIGDTQALDGCALPCQTATFIAGINGATGLSNPVPVVIDPVTGQLGTGSASGGSITGVTAGTGLTGGGASGNVSLSVNQSVVAFQTDLTTAANAAQAAAVAAAASYANSTFLPLAGSATLTGGLTGTTASFSSFNSTNPYQIGGSNVLSVAGTNNLFVGSSAGANTTGTGNTATGDNAGLNLTTGSSNIMLGYQAGQNFTSNESNNIDIGNQGVAAESGVIRIGTAGAQTAAYFAGISGVTVPAPQAVVIGSNGQLGTGTLASGSITGVTAGSGLTGGGSSGNVTLSIPAGGVTTSMLASPSLTVTAGTGLSGGGSVALGGTTTLSLASNSCANGYAVQGLPLTCTPVAGRTANTFTATQTVSSGDVSISSGNIDLSQNTAASVGVITMGGTPFISACCSVGQQSTFLGQGAGNFTLTGNYNTGTGYGALASITTGSYNTATGASALNANTTGTNNTALGPASLYKNTVGNNNTAVGYGTLLNNTSGSDNTVIGDGALFYNATGSSNTAVGWQALALNTASNNTAVGASALYATTTGVNNTAVGSDALMNNTTGNYNSAGSTFVLLHNTTGSGNTASGYAALSSNGTGSYNTVNGYSAGGALSTGSSNIILGANAGQGFSSNESNNIVIGSPGASGDSGVTRIGTNGAQTTAYMAGIFGVTVSGGSTVLINSSGQLGTVLSSRRYKEDIRDMGAASDGLLRLHPVTFRYKKPLEDGTKPVQYGLIAEEVAKVYPDMVIRNKDGQIETVQYYKLDAMLLNEVQKLSKEHAADQAEIARLQSQVAEQAKQGQEQQAAMKQLLAQVHGIQVSLASGRSARRHSQVARTAAHHPTKPEVKVTSSQPALPLEAKVRF